MTPTPGPAWQPRLVAIAGPLRGQTFALEPPEARIGRETGNHIATGDARLSRAHATIAVDPARAEAVIRDLESRNGTFVGGVPIRQRRLADGDRIEVGASTFVFVEADEDQPPLDAGVRIDSKGLRLLETIEVSRDGVPLITPGASAAATDERVAARALPQLLAVTRTLYSTCSVTDWAGALCAAVFETLPVDRVAVVLVGPAGRLDTSIGRVRGSENECTILVDEALVQQAMENGIAVLGRPQGDENRTVAAAPLLATRDCQGVVVVDARADLTPSHLHVLAAIGATAAGALEHVREVAWLIGERQRLTEELRAEHEMVGESTAMRRVYERIARLAPTGTTVLIQGESGTGKELVARALHANSPRADRAFVALNCAAISESLLESELFGHERGAFTGAVARKLGKLEVASGGTLLLDEVGEMSPSLQAKLLRAIETQELERVGGVTPVRVDVRVLAATNRDLEQAVKDGSFRGDLYYRLNVVRITLPPLRERRDDIALLASHFAARCSRTLKRPMVAISPEARERLLRHDWPGNVRELRNAIEHAVVLGSDDVLRAEDLPEHVALVPAEAAPSAGRYEDVVREAKIRVIRGAIEEAQGSIVGAAAILGLHPNYLHRLLRNLGLRERG